MYPNIWLSGQNHDTDLCQGSRRCYAFAEFQSDDDAIDFMEKHYPTLDISGSNGPYIQIRLEYSRERRNAASTDDWICSMVSKNDILFSLRRCRCLSDKFIVPFPKLLPPRDMQAVQSTKV